jgi:hypothetical protein
LNNSVKLLTELAKNKVVLLSKLKVRNYPLYKYTTGNLAYVTKALNDQGYYMLDDLSSMKDLEKIKLYVLHYYGKTVNLTVLRTSDRTIYNYLSDIGNPHLILESFGFEVVFTRKSPEATILAELNRIADENGYIHTISDPSLYQKLYYRATKSEKTVQEFILNHGFQYRNYDINRIVQLRNDGLTYQEIADAMSLSRATVQRIHSQEVSGNDLHRQVQEERGGH